MSAPAKTKQKAARRGVRLSATRRFRLAAVGTLASVTLFVFTLTPAGPVGPPYRDENLTAGYYEPLRLADEASIREELRLTEAQSEKIKAALAKQSSGKGGKSAAGPRVPRMGRAHQQAFLATVLEPEQAKRLQQIILQRLGGLALGNRQTADALELTEAQRARVDALVDQLAFKINERRSTTRGPQPPSRETQVERTTTGDKLLALLTSQQQQRWQELLGPAFTGELRTFGQGGGPPGGQKGGGNGNQGAPRGGAPGQQKQLP